MPGQPCAASEPPPAEQAHSPQGDGQQPQPNHEPAGLIGRNQQSRKALEQHQRATQNSQECSHRDPSLAPAAGACRHQGQQPHTKWEHQQRVVQHQGNEKGEKGHRLAGMAGKGLQEGSGLAPGGLASFGPRGGAIATQRATQTSLWRGNSRRAPDSDSPELQRRFELHTLLQTSPAAPTASTPCPTAGEEAAGIVVNGRTGRRGRPNMPVVPTGVARPYSHQ